ncbi:TIGR03643 family protein [Pseudahrensia aquimaris]|uniref:TIGR03643 family protein n=1 Tax=Pseudahrensia aquimaris TaxID=744461 RepID=A0ABW3FC65_9HYPH
MTTRSFPEDWPNPHTANHPDASKPTDSEIIELAWCDDTTFDSIKAQTGLNENEVIKLMRQSLKPKSFRLWRKRVSGRAAKHSAKIDGSA